jgi:hypothetical protein
MPDPSTSAQLALKSTGEQLGLWVGPNGYAVGDVVVLDGHPDLVVVERQWSGPYALTLLLVERDDNDPRTGGRLLVEMEGR